MLYYIIYYTILYAILYAILRYILGYNICYTLFILADEQEMHECYDACSNYGALVWEVLKVWAHNKCFVLQINNNSMILAC